MKNDQYVKCYKKAAKIKISKRLDGIEDAPFFKKKMEKAEKLLAIAGLPK